MDYYDREETVDVASNATVALWLKEKAKRDPAAFARLVQDNRRRMERLFGRQAGKRSEGLVWTAEEGGSQMFICSSKDGTVVKIHYPGGERAYAADRKMGSAMTAFMERLMLDLAGQGPLKTF